MRLRALKFSLPSLLFIGAFVSFHSRGWIVWLPLAFAWIAVPLLELFIKPNASNMDAAEEEIARNDRTYDFVLYAVVLFQYAALFEFLRSINDPALAWHDVVGRIWVMGLLCGVFGINVGHELGHRVNRFEQSLAKILLLSSLYMHFSIEHNKGHHKRVATPEDPSSARFGEWIYGFYFRTIVFGYLSAWQIANTEQRKKNRPAISFKNEMLVFHIIEIVFFAVMFFAFGWFAAVCFLASATIGILLLETVNYIEHYGLQRKPAGDGKYERAMPVHSWNSDHIIGRLFLFELSRHSDHHYLAVRKYQVLRHYDHSPQMPTGYPGMMLLALVPPAWFMIMNKRVKAIRNAS